jgi:hypothetical protein
LCLSYSEVQKLSEFLETLSEKDEQSRQKLELYIIDLLDKTIEVENQSQLLVSLFSTIRLATPHEVSFVLVLGCVIHQYNQFDTCIRIYVCISAYHLCCQREGSLKQAV